ncbi:pentatricopeptide repeat-containing protein mitochondrial-like [Dorcoceras hygrometricum]|uniref:Pentatricopeptide repeat-containing protein mitochondrial-like n=1 Tax=Dorcoceras hygrometricum TaxID=472368 RepID=A0A2Z7BPI0_9LAMI|nr:pentatricopeptide repeat-containing protein mitochondrial-like [Dorcoceras hygrometricum]
MQRHTDYGFLPKTQPNLIPVVHVSLYRWSKYNITRIFVSFRIVDVTSGPDLHHTYSYTSILRLGLMAGDTPDAPITTSGLEDRAAYSEPRRTIPRSANHQRMHSKIGNPPRPHYHLGSVSRGPCPDAMKSPAQVPLLEAVVGWSEISKLLYFGRVVVRSAVSFCFGREFLLVFPELCVCLAGVGIRSLGPVIVEVVLRIKDARASGDSALSSPCWDLLAPMHRVDARASGDSALSSPCGDLLAPMRRVGRVGSARTPALTVATYSVADFVELCIAFFGSLPWLIGGRSNPVVDLIRRNLPPPTVKCRFPRETGRSQAPRRQQGYSAVRGANPAGGAPGGG